LIVTTKSTNGCRVFPNIQTCLTQVEKLIEANIDLMFFNGVRRAGRQKPLLADLYILKVLKTVGVFVYRRVNTLHDYIVITQAFPRLSLALSKHFPKLVFGTIFPEQFVIGIVGLGLFWFSEDKSFYVIYIRSKNLINVNIVLLRF